MKKKLLSLALVLSLCLGVMAPAFAATTKFADVPTTHWTAADIDYVVKKGLFSGTSTTTFSPDGKITQGQMAVVLGRYAGQDVDNSTPWYQKGMDWANENMIIHSYEPGHQLTREEFAAMMYNFAKHIGKDTTIQNDVMDMYVDSDSVSAGCTMAMRWAVSIGLINGTGTFHLSPKNLVTRVQVAAMLARYDRGNNQSAPAPTPVPTPTPTPTPTPAPSPNIPSSSGLLKNGKPATPENVIEMLKEIEKQYPTGTPWTSPSRNPNTLYNPNPVSSTISNLMWHIDWRGFIDTKYACGGFAAMVSDLIFPEEMECREVTDMSKVRPGDIVFDIREDGTVSHVWVTTSYSRPTKFSGLWEVEHADGNWGNKIDWDYGREAPNTLYPKEWRETGQGTSYTRVYTRYPN